MLKLGIFAWDFDGNFRGCFDDGFGEYMYIYTRVGTLYVELGFGLRILMFLMIVLLKYFIVEIWFADMDFLRVFMRWIRFEAFRWFGYIAFHSCMPRLFSHYHVHSI